jgi:hypothetical protein
MATITTTPRRHTTVAGLPPTAWAAIVVVFVITATLVTLYLVRTPAETTVDAGAPAAVVESAGPYYWEDIARQALAQTPTAVIPDTFYVDGLEQRAAEAQAAIAAPTTFVSGYYWEEVGRMAVDASVATADVPYIQQLERMAADGRAALAVDVGATGYYWEEINRQALERSGGTPTLAEQIEAQLTK